MRIKLVVKHSLQGIQVIYFFYYFVFPNVCSSEHLSGLKVSTEAILLCHAAHRSGLFFKHYHPIIIVFSCSLDTLLVESLH